MSPTKLDRLTAAQEARLSEFRERWLSRGLATGPVDRAGAERAMALAYAAAKLPPPNLVVWLQSPLAGCVGAALLAQVRNQVWNQVVAQVVAQVRAQVVDQVVDQVWTAGYGQHDASWLSFYDFFGDACGVGSAALEGLLGLGECGWWWAFRGAVILTERPITLQRDDAGRLHCENGHAIAYPDGWGVYAWHGVRVPADVILHPEAITADRITAETNAELRRVMLARYGEARYIEAIGAKPIASDHYGALFRVDRLGDDPLLMVKVQNSTPEPDGSIKDYWLRVHPELRPLLAGGQFGEPQPLTAHAAVASTFGLSAAEYHPDVET